jgi:hypothetical protein
MVDTVLPGSLVFFLPPLIRHGPSLILRKALYEIHTTREWGATEFAHNESDNAENYRDRQCSIYVVEKICLCAFHPKKPYAGFSTILVSTISTR